MSIRVFHKHSIAVHGDFREFSEQVHGKDFRAIADSYAERYAANVDHIEDTEAKVKAETKPEEVLEVKLVKIKKKK